MVRRCPAVFHSKIFGHTPHLLGIRWAFPSNSPVMPVVAGDLPPKARPLHTCAGSPVHTGIDPLTKTPDINPSWFPRAYGDRPISKRGENDLTRVPPCIRGSTQIPEDNGPEGQGSSVHAGIDLSMPAPPPGATRFPLRAGIDPKIPVTEIRRFPHTRGDRPDTPTHACRFPRILGDQPSLPRTSPVMKKIPPHTRGINSRDNTPTGPLPGFPRIREDQPRSA